VLFLYYNQKDTDTITYYDNQNESYSFTMDKNNPDIENLVKWLNHLHRERILEHDYTIEHVRT